MDLLLSYIREALTPFEPGGISVFADMPWDIVEIEIPLLPGYIARVDAEWTWIYNNPDDAICAVGQEAGKYFASIREPIGDHICLGEN